MASADPAASRSSHQLFSGVAEIPSSFATLVNVAPGVESRATASVLYSAVNRRLGLLAIIFLQVGHQFTAWSGIRGQGHEAATLKAAFGQGREEALNRIKPRARGGREVK